MARQCIPPHFGESAVLYAAQPVRYAAQPVPPTLLSAVSISRSPRPFTPATDGDHTLHLERNAGLHHLNICSCTRLVLTFSAAYKETQEKQHDRSRPQGVHSIHKQSSKPSSI